MSEYIITLLPGSGIGSAIVYIVASLYYLHINGIHKIPLVNLHFASKPVRLFFEHFVDIKNVTAVQFIDSDQMKSERKELFGTEETNVVYANIVTRKDIDIHIAKFKEIWKLKQHIIDECNKLNVYDICLNIRRGDKITLEPSHKITIIEEYIVKISDFGLENPTIFHTADDYTTLSELKNLHPELNISSFCSEIDNGFYLADMNSKDDLFVIKHIDKFIKELHIMETSPYFIGVRCTNVGYLTTFLRESASKTNTYFLD